MESAFHHYERYSSYEQNEDDRSGTTNVPWQDRPAGSGAPMWRYEGNPIIGRNPLPGVARIFNSAVMPFEGAFIGVFRGEQTDGVPHIYLGRSQDGIRWQFELEKIPFVNEAGEPFMPPSAYDPRLVKVEDTYYIMWCTDFYGAAIGLAKTKDFKTFVRLENPFLPFNRNAVLFPRKIGGNFVMLSRPSDSRAYAVWRYLPVRKPGPRVLGQAPPRHGPCKRVVAIPENRRRRRAHRNHRGLAPVLPRRVRHVLRLCVFRRRRDTGLRDPSKVKYRCERLPSNPRSVV